MACTDLRKVWTDIKGHRKKVLKCMDKKTPKKRGKNKKKITQPLNLADFVRHPANGRSQRRKKKIKPKKQKRPLPPPPARNRVEATFGDDVVDEIVPLRKFKTRVARQYASTNPGNW